jgi:hypothetical protein
MHLSGTLRRYVACTVAVLLLACQGMVVAYAGPATATPTGAAEVPESCHESGSRSGGISAGTLCDARCKSLDPSTHPIVKVFTTGDLPAITTATRLPATATEVTHLRDSLLLQIEPPPLRILNCCLRN